MQSFVLDAPSDLVGVRSTGQLRDLAELDVVVQGNFDPLPLFSDREALARRGKGGPLVDNS